MGLFFYFATIFKKTKRDRNLIATAFFIKNLASIDWTSETNKKSYFVEIGTKKSYLVIWWFY